MPQGGRKHSGGPGPLAALAGFHERLREAMGNAHVGSINQLIRCVGVGIPRNRVYEICQGREIARREEVILLARVLTAPVEPLLAAWEDAKIAVERQELARLSARHKDRESWHDIPLPTGVLLDILKAQNQVSDTFPYRLLGVTPPGISTIYVTPSLRQNRPPERSTHEEPTRATAPTEVPFEVSLARHEHLLVVGDPGHGKSVLGRSLVRQLSGRWLREHGTAPLSEAVVPLYVQATAVPQTGSWSSRLAHVARQSGYMVTEPEATLFADRVQGARWLVVIDGLDEIHDRDRRLELLNILHQRITNSGPYRLVITSRPLPPGELELLRDSEMGEYSLLPFGPDQLAEFARNWFRVQGVADVDIEVDRFTSHIATSDLAEVSRVPLLATIALAMQTTSPGRPLPATQMELYERFVDELLHARGTPPSTVQENVVWWSWLQTARPALLSYLAQLHWDKEVDLVTAALGWVKQQRPIDLQLPREAEEYVVQTLIASGLVTFNGAVLRFIHQSIIEFLAGLHLASQAGNSFSDIKKWVDPEKILDSKKLALFTVASWCRIEATDGSQVVRALLGEKMGSVNALVELISVGVDIDPDMEEIFVERLIDLFRYNSSDSQGLAEYVAKVKRLSSLSSRLEEVAINDVLHPDSRIEAAVAYAKCYSMPRGVAILVEISQSVDATNRLGALYELYDLGYEFSKLTIRARHILVDTKASAWTRVNAAALLKDCNDLDGVVEVVKKIAAESETTDGDFTHAAEFLIEHGGVECVRLVMEMIGRHRHGLISDLGGVVRAMSAVDAHAETKELAQRYLRHPEAGQDEEEIREVLTAWASSARKTGCGDEIVAALRAMRISRWEITDLAKILRKAGLSAEAVSLLKDLVSRLK